MITQGVDEIAQTNDGRTQEVQRINRTRAGITPTDAGTTQTRDGITSKVDGIMQKEME